MATVAEAWILHCEARGLEATTLTSYRQKVRDYILPHLGAVKLSRLAPPEVQTFLDGLIADGMSLAMARKVRTDLVMLLNFAEARGQVGRNAARPTKLARSNKRKAPVVIPTPAQILDLRTWLETAHNEPRQAELARRARPLLFLAWSVGLRASELRGLTWHDLDLDGAEVTVNQRADRYGLIGPPKSEAAYRSIPLPEACILALRHWRLEALPNDLDLVFPNGAGRPQALNNLRRRLILPALTAAELTVPAPTAVDPAARKLAIDQPLHGFRHFAASIWIHQGASMKQLTTWLGHSDIKLTYNTYGHLLERSPAEAAAFMARVEAYVFGEPPK